jgi:hypothetical protein
MTFSITNDIFLVTTDYTAPFFKMGNFAALIYSTALTTYTALRVRLSEAGDISTGFTSL